MRHAVIVMFEISNGEIHVGVNLKDDAGEVASSAQWTAGEPDVWMALSEAYDAVKSFWQHGLMFAEPLGDDGWKTRKWGL